MTRPAKRVGTLLALALGAACATPSRGNVRELAAGAPTAPSAIQVTRQEELDDESLAKELANPVSPLARVPFRLGYDDDVGPEGAEGERWSLELRPVVPWALVGESYLVSRTVLPVISQQGATSDEDETGLGDMTQSFYYVPRAGRDWTFGIGPVFTIPTATEKALGTDRWSAGPGLVVVRQGGSLTFGALAEHVWSYGGDDDRDGVNSTLLSPFVALTSSSALTLTLDAEATYDWRDDELVLPVGLEAAKVLELGDQRIQLGAGVRYWTEESDVSPEGVGFRFTVTPVFPR